MYKRVYKKMRFERVYERMKRYPRRGCVDPYLWSSPPSLLLQRQCQLCTHGFHTDRCDRGGSSLLTHSHMSTPRHAGTVRGMGGMGEGVGT